MARSLGLGLNAGHDLSLENLNYFYTNIPWLDEVSIGHALISDALYLGLERTNFRNIKIVSADESYVIIRPKWLRRWPILLPVPIRYLLPLLLPMK